MTPELPIFRDGTVDRRLGTLRRPRGHRMMAAAPALIPESEWVEFDYRTTDHPVKILDQGGFGACVGHATATALMWSRWLAGMTHVDLSPWYLYAILCDGVDRGSSISEALDLAIKSGTCPFGDVPWGTINPRNLSAESHRDAANHRAEIGSRVATFDEMMSETQRRRVGNFSVGVGRGFNDLDADGVPPTTGSLNHSVMFGLAAIRGKDGEWLIGCANSWGPDWGLKGYFNIRRSTIRRGNDAWALAAPLDTPGDPTNGPVAIL